MRFSSILPPVVLALASFSQVNSKPTSQVPGYTLIYSNVKSLPSEETRIETFREFPGQEPVSCGRTCDAIPACQFFAIFTPLGGGEKACQYYKSQDPYNGNSNDTMFGHQVQTLCGFQKNQLPDFAPNVTESSPSRRRMHRRRLAHRMAKTYKRGETYAAPSNCSGNSTSGTYAPPPSDEYTDSNTGTYEKRSVNLVPYFPDEEVQEKRCGAICKSYLALRSVWK